jgi:hypothetical protein
MLSCYPNYLAAMPDVTVYMNCDTRLAINLGLFELGEDDEFIFTIKNFSYKDSSYAFMYRARKSDMDEHGEIIFNIDPDASKNIKPGAFYNFTLLTNAYNPRKLSEYHKLTKDGKIIIEYGAHDLALPDEHVQTSPFSDILSAKLEPDDGIDGVSAHGTVVDMRVERCDNA